MALRCPNCNEVTGFSIVCSIEVDYNEHEHLRRPLEEDDLHFSPDDSCTCLSCGNNAEVSVFREHHDNYMPDSKTAFRAIWTGMSEMNRINDAVREKDVILGDSMSSTRHRLYDLLGQLERMVKRYEYNSQRH